MLPWLDEQDLGRHLEREQFHLLVGEGHGCRDHFAVVQEEPNDVGGSPVELRSELLCGHTTLDDDDALWNRSI